MKQQFDLEKFLEGANRILIKIPDEYLVKQNTLKFLKLVEDYYRSKGDFAQELKKAYIENYVIGRCISSDKPDIDWKKKLSEFMLNNSTALHSCKGNICGIDFLNKSANITHAERKEEGINAASFSLPSKKYPGFYPENQTLIILTPLLPAEQNNMLFTSEEPIMFDKTKEIRDATRELHHFFKTHLYEIHEFSNGDMFTIVTKYPSKHLNNIRSKTVSITGFADGKPKIKQMRDKQFFSTESTRVNEITFLPGFSTNFTILLNHHYIKERVVMDNKRVPGNVFTILTILKEFDYWKKYIEEKSIINSSYPFTEEILVNGEQDINPLSLETLEKLHNIYKMNEDILKDFNYAVSSEWLLQFADKKIIRENIQKAKANKEFYPFGVNQYKQNHPLKEKSFEGQINEMEENPAGKTCMLQTDSQVNIPHQSVSSKNTNNIQIS